MCGSVNRRGTSVRRQQRHDVPRQQFVDAVNRVIGDAVDDAMQVGLGIDPVQARGTDEAVHRRRAFAAGIRTGEQIVPAADRHPVSAR